MSRPTLDQLEAFLTVADTGSFSAAGRRLHRAQSGLSYAVSELERLLGVEVFDRSGYRPLLTSTGEVLLAHARTVLGDVQQLEAVASAAEERIEPRVELVTDTLLPPEVLLHAVTSFSGRYPETELSVRSESRLTVLRLVDEGAALGVCAQPPTLRGHLAQRQLRPFTAVPVAAPSHPLFCQDAPLTLSILRRHTQLVLTERDAEARRAPGDATSGGRAWRVTDMTTKHQWLLGGLGWGYMPQVQVEEDLRQRRLRRLPLTEGAELRGAFFAIYPAATPPGPAACFLLEGLS